MKEKNNYSKVKEKKDWSAFLKENWFVIFLIISFIVTVISLIIRSILPEQVPIQENTWNGITPGHSKYTHLVEKMGAPIGSIETKEGYELEYQSNFPVSPNKVITDKEGVVTFIKEYLLYDETHTLTKYTDLYGSPDLILEDSESSLALKANIFLEQGLVIVAHIKDGSVEQIWYFEPTDEITFLSSWGKSLSEDAHGPDKPN